MDVLPILRELFANGLDQELRLRRGRTRLGLGKMAFKCPLQFGDLDSRVTVGSFGYLDRRGLQPPQDILHRVGGLNRREVLGQVARMGVIHPVEVVDGRTANRQPQQADHRRWRYDLSPHGGVSVGSAATLPRRDGDCGLIKVSCFRGTRQSLGQYWQSNHGAKRRLSLDDHGPLGCNSILSGELCRLQRTGELVAEPERNCHGE